MVQGDDFRRSRTEFFVVGGDVASVCEDDRQFFCEIEDERHSAAVVLGHRPDAVGASEFKSRGEKEGLALKFGGAETVDHKVAEAFRICSGFDGAVPAQEVRGNKRIVVAVDCGGRERHFNQMDVLNVWGCHNQIYAISIARGHGYLRLQNDAYFVGGWIEVGQSVIRKITEDMLLVDREG